jgi:hypothetical protein
MVMNVFSFVSFWGIGPEVNKVSFSAQHGPLRSSNHFYHGINIEWGLGCCTWSCTYLYSYRKV